MFYPFPNISTKAFDIRQLQLFVVNMNNPILIIIFIPKTLTLFTIWCLKTLLFDTHPFVETSSSVGCQDNDVAAVMFPLWQPRLANVYSQSHGGEVVVVVGCGQCSCRQWPGRARDVPPVLLCSSRAAILTNQASQLRREISIIVSFCHLKPSLVQQIVQSKACSS